MKIFSIIASAISVRYNQMGIHGMIKHIITYYLGTLTGGIIFDKIRKVDFVMPDYYGNKYFNYNNIDAHVYYLSRKYVLKYVKQLGITNNDMILDIGCGKGKTLYWFSKLGFCQADGVEISPVLAQIAKENMKKLKISSCNVFISDATSFDKYHNYNYFYMFNPFGEETMRSVIEKITESLEKNPRRVTIIYMHPTCDHIILENGLFRLISKWDAGNAQPIIYGTNLYSNDY